MCNFSSDSHDDLGRVFGSVLNGYAFFGIKLEVPGRRCSTTLFSSILPNYDTHPDNHSKPA